MDKSIAIHRVTQLASRSRYCHYVLVFHILVNYSVEAGGRLELPLSSCRVADVAVEGFCLLNYPAIWGGLLAFLP